MDFAVGEILEGKVTGITKFGAFVSLPGGKSGMVHISEVANTFVKDIREHLQEKQEVRVKIIKVDKEGRLNLSIKQAMETGSGKPAYRKPAPKTAAPAPAPKTPQEQFEDRLKMFMKDSESRMADLKHNMDKKNGSRRRK
jgi:S1 RNA binding domain protein